MRRRDGVEVIGAALTAKARGDGHRRIAADLGRRPRRCGAGCAASPTGPAHYGSTSPGGRTRSTPATTTARPVARRFVDAVEAIGVLGVVAVRRFGPRPPWSLASVRHRRRAALQHELTLP